ncbi:MAG: efflux RND transporter permease subunit [Rhodospirillaceae bacterium]|nr:efflux RND transporter permease subunit [Rhodospirillaceae bacterium]
MTFTDLFIRRPVLSIVVSLLILLVGLRAIFDLPLRQFPELTNTVITVSTAYPGAPAELMQGFITTPIEQAVASVDGVDYITSNSTQSASTVTAYIKLNRDSGDAMTEVMSKVQQVKYQLPRESNDPIITKSVGQSVQAMYMSFASPEMPSAAISDYIARVVRPLISTVEGVASVEIIGGQIFAMRLWLDPQRMAARNVTADQVAAAIRANNYQSAPGQAKGFFIVTNVTADTALTDVEQFRDLVVKSQDGALVRLRDIATVDLGPQSSNTSAMISGENAVIIGISPTPSGNPLDVSRGIHGVMPEIDRTLPPTLKYALPYDVATFIQASIDEVAATLIEAMIIVIVVIFLFLGNVRSVLIPVITIPLSIIGVAVFMLALGFSLNLLTLLAMVLAIGLVVDDAIVVVENVYRHIEEGYTPVQAALTGAREIVGPVIAMTITLAAVYAPIGFLGGLTGALFREFAFTLAGAVIISGVIALTLSPMMCSTLLKHDVNQGAFAKKVDAVFSRVTAWYASKLSLSLDYRPVTAMVGVAVLGLVGFLFLNTRQELAPAEDQGAVLAQIAAPKYANLDYTVAYGRKLDEILASYPEVRARFILFGMGGPGGGIAAMDLKPWNERDRSAMQLQPDLQKKLNTLDGVKGFAFSMPSLPGPFGGLPVQFVLSSATPYENIFKVTEELKDHARKSGLFMVVDSNLAFDSPVIRMEIDRAKASDLGISMQSIGDTLAILVGENYVNRFSLEGRSYEVIPQVPRAARLTAESLRGFYVKTASGEQIPLSTIVGFHTDVEPTGLNRYNQLNSAIFSAIPMPGTSMGQAVEFLQGEAAKLPQGYTSDFLGESRQYVEEGNQLLYTFAFALIAIYLVLAAQFESLRDPLVIMVSVPMSIFGALLPLYFGLSTINIYTQVGLVTLIGLITKHGILMVSFARDMQINEQVDRRTAIEHAAQVRLRPILMTTAAMVSGLFPLLFASGAGAASRFSLGLVVVSGMAIGTLFTLFVLPAVYTWLATDHRALANSARTREMDAAAPAE